MAARDLGAARADQAGQAEDLATAHRERDVGEDPVAGEAADLEGHARPVAPRCGEERVERRVPTISRTSSLSELAGGRVATVAAVAQHRDAVGDRAHLLEAVADVEDATPRVAQAARRRGTAARPRAGERRRRLVHDQHARVVDSALAISTSCRSATLRRLAHRRAGSMSTPSSSSSRRASGSSRAQSTSRGPAAAGADEDVLGDGQVGEDRELLVDDGDAEAPAPLRVRAIRCSSPATGSRRRPACGRRRGS